VTEEHRQQSIQCYGHCKEGGGDRSEPVTHHRAPHQKEVHMKMYKEGICAAKAMTGFSKGREVSSCIGAGGAFGAPNGRPQWEVP
jgi:hypothetical protein